MRYPDKQMSAQMKLPFSWIKQCIPLTQTSAEIAKLLTSAGLEVDGIHVQRPAFSGVVVAKVLETRPHPMRTSCSWPR